MVTVGLFIRVEAKPDKVPEAEALLRSAVDHVREEGLAIMWCALRLGPTTFAVFDAFAGEADREAHLEANAQALRAELFAGPPVIEHAAVVAAMLPGE